MNLLIFSSLHGNVKKSRVSYFSPIVSSFEWKDPVHWFIKPTS